jgi:hypothetical protein
MTTKSDRPVTRETSAFTRDRGLRPVLVTIEHGLLVLRAKGLRTRETVDVSWLYQFAVKARVAQERAEKRLAKKARRA